MLLYTLAAVLAVAAASAVGTGGKVVCYYDSKSYVRECKYIILLLSVLMPALHVRIQLASFVTFEFGTGSATLLSNPGLGAMNNV